MVDCIYFCKFQTKIVPVDPISTEEKLKTLKRLDEVIQCRLCVSEIPKHFNHIKICKRRFFFLIYIRFE